MALLDEEKPPTKTQLKKIAKLRGDPQNVTNRGQADDYLSDLEDQAEELKERAEHALGLMSCPEMGFEFSVKNLPKLGWRKPSCLGNPKAGGKTGKT